MKMTKKKLKSSAKVTEDYGLDGRLSDEMSAGSRFSTDYYQTYSSSSVNTHEIKSASPYIINKRANPDMFKAVSWRHQPSSEYYPVIFECTMKTPGFHFRRIITLRF